MNFIKKRIIISIIVFFVAINIDFFLPRFVPGNAAEVFASGRLLPPSAVHLIEQRFGLDQPLYVQYYLFLKGIFSWPPFFGFSFQYYPTDVSTLIASRAVWTILLIVSAFALSIAISLVLGLFALMKRGSKTERSALYVSIIFWSAPGFLVSLLILYIFAVVLKVLPAFGTTGFETGSTIQLIGSVLQHAILPVGAMTLIIFGQSYIILRGAAQEILGSDYITAAKQRGLRDRVISFRYVIKNALLPLVSLTGFYVANLISLAVVIEFVFGYGGVGDLIVDAILNHDYPVIEGAFFYVTLIVILLGLVGDYFLLRLDPRLRR